MGDLKKILANENGWSDWINPMHGHGKHNYLMGCCDCGLVHEMQFRVFTDSKNRQSVKFRAKRHEQIG